MVERKTEASIFDYTGRSDRAAAGRRARRRGARRPLRPDRAPVLRARPTRLCSRSCCTRRAFEGSEEPSSRAAWRELVEACAARFRWCWRTSTPSCSSAPARPQVTPYLTHYADASTRPTTRWCELRQQLAALGDGAARGRAVNPKTTSPACAKPCALLLQCNSAPPKSRRPSSSAFVYRGAIAFCDAVTASHQARFYRLRGALRARVLRRREERLRDGWINVS